MKLAIILSALMAFMAVSADCLSKEGTAYLPSPCHGNLIVLGHEYVCWYAD